MKIKEKYKTQEACKILGLKRSNIQFYKDQGLVKPDDLGEGRGSKIFFSPRNLVEIAYVRHLAESGMTLKTLPALFDDVQGKVDEKNKIESKKFGLNIDFLDPLSTNPDDKTLFLMICFESLSLKERRTKEVEVFTLPDTEIKFPFMENSSIFFINLTRIMVDVIKALEDFHKTS